MANLTNTAKLIELIDSIKLKLNELEDAIPVKLSELENDEGFITKAVDDLIHYYDKDEVDDLLAGIVGLEIVKVDVLPAEGENGKIYLVPSTSTPDTYDEYIWVASDSAFEKIGNLHVDLSDYYTKTQVDDKLDLKADKTELDDYYKKTETYNKTEVDDKLDLKADKTELDDYYKKTETYNKTEVDGKLDLKADKTELDDYYKKTETYNKTEVDGKLDLKADKTELADYYKKTETYNKTEVDGKLAEKQDVLTAGDGISIANKVISNTGVLTVNGDDGDVVVNDVKKSATAPANPTEGTVWYDTTNDILKTYDGTTWHEVGAGTGDVKYEDFEFATMTGTVIENLSAKKSISTDVTLTAGTSLKEGMQYLVVVSNTDTAKHTVTFGTETIDVEAGENKQLVFLATSSNTLELQVCTGGGGGGGSTPGNGKLTINQKGTKKGEFTANQTTDVTVDIDADMSYEDFNFSAKTGTTVTLDLNTSISPSSNITVNKPTELKEGQTYILRVSPTANMSVTLGSGITNPFDVDLSLIANSTNQFVFLATSNSELELQPELLTRADVEQILRDYGLIS